MTAIDRQLDAVDIFSLLTHLSLSHRIPPNMNKHGLGTMTMTTTSGKNREAFVLGQN
jgi:hypothetical protein